MKRRIDFLMLGLDENVRTSMRSWDGIYYYLDVKFERLNQNPPYVVETESGIAIRLLTEKAEAYVRELRRSFPKFYSGPQTFQVRRGYIVVEDPDADATTFRDKVQPLSIHGKDGGLRAVTGGIQWKEQLKKDQPPAYVVTVT